MKNPTIETRVKMAAAASALHARVQGDDGEFYCDDGTSLPEAAG